MGIRFHYKGTLKKPSFLQDLIEEVIDMAISHHWKYEVYEDQFPNNEFIDTSDGAVYGMSFTPENCEAICFTFLSNGQLYDFGNQTDSDKFRKKWNDAYLSVQTQFAGPEIHKQLIVIFEYLNKKYLENFDFIDEGNYWETKNEHLLIETFDKYANLIIAFDRLLDDLPLKENETIEEYLIRIAQTNYRKRENDE